MTRSNAITDSLAQMVVLLRDQPDDKDAQKSAFRAFMVRMAEQPATIAVTDGRLMVDGEPGDDADGAEDLRRQLLLHGLGEIVIPGTLNPGQLLTVVRALAAPGGTFLHLHQFSEYLAGAGVRDVKLSPAAPAGVSSPTPLPAPAVLTPPPQAVSANETDGEIEALGPDAANEESVGLLHFVTLELKSIGRLDELLIDLERNPDSPQTGELLNEALGFGDIAAQKEQWSDLIRVAASLVRLESLVTNENHGRLYSIALRRLVTRTILEQIARALPQTDQRAESIMILRRIGEDAMEVLVQLLIAEKDVGRRRVYFNAVTQMTEGTDLLVHMLGHDEWFVVRNVAELCGEMNLEAAVPALAKQVFHSDDRVRRAATGALARIGSPATLEPLRHALQDPSPMVRLQAASGLEGSRAKNLVPALARLVEEEGHADVQREMLHALGRIGTPEAVEALIRASQPGRGFFKKKPQAIRIESIEGLRLAGGPAAVAALQDLQNDKGDDVRRAADLALKTTVPKKN